MSASPSSPRSPSSPSYTTSEDSESVSFTLPPLSNTFSLSAQNKLDGDSPNSNVITIAPGQVLEVRDGADGVPEIEIHPASVLVDDSPAVSVSSPSNAPTPTPPNPVSPGLDATSTSEAPELAGFKSPNVYINGLPPHYPEDQLFELAKPFGTVRSVRSFTRHVGERESGYGFVLFETIEAAERCIISLRRFRNLHPTFSKQIHKIPGAPYSPVLSSVSLPSSNASAWEHESASTASFPAGSVSDNASFKARMEKLQDPNSTNLYIEGLPMTIDESSLTALVQPHRIKSFRFFQTRLSDPPRIIAFVRLETRQGAEEVIERLHGRMVRGWNDPGSRISVRFADTSEQRELRRAERNVRDGEQSPARLTIAQAALLNLRGRDNLPTVTSQNALSNFPVSTSASLSAPASQTLYQSVLQRPIIGAAPGGDFASNAAGARYQSGSLPRLPPIHAQNPHATRVDSHISPSVTALFDAMRRDGVPFEPEPPIADQAYLSQQLHQYAQRQPQIQAQATRNGSGAPIQLGHPGKARGGYTPTEEYILQAHAASAHPGVGSFQAKRRPPSASRVDFGRAYGGAPFDASSNPEYNVGLGLGVRAYRAQASTVSLPPGDGPAQAHVRSTTLPQQSQSHPQARHFPHNSLSNPIAPRQSQSSSHLNSHPTLDGLHTYSHPSSHSSSLHQYSKHRSNQTHPSSNQVFGNSNNEQLSLQSSHLHSHSNKNHSHINTSNHLNQHRLYTSDINHPSAYTNENGGTIELDSHTIDIHRLRLASPKAVEGGCVPPNHHHKNINIDIDIYKHRHPHRLQVDPPLVSPALTYGSGLGETPMSLSPVTPFMSEFREEFGVVDG